MFGHVCKTIEVKDGVISLTSQYSQAEQQLWIIVHQTLQSGLCAAYCFAINNAFEVLNSSLSDRQWHKKRYFCSTFKGGDKFPNRAVWTGRFSLSVGHYEPGSQLPNLQSAISKQWSRFPILLSSSQTHTTQTSQPEHMAVGQSLTANCSKWFQQDGG